jgi:2-oxoglutarate ferredoxin oxidoreductase subunit beta
MEAALDHTESRKGFAFLEVLSPCVTYYDTHREWRARVYNMDEEEGYDPADRSLAFQRCLKLRNEGRIPIGHIFKGVHPSLESLILNKAELPPAQQKVGHEGHREQYDKFINSYMG